ncbi:hypothetical protein B5C26_13345 [Photorhabdus luminescens]|uniref:hypothetical protein n=1 Tax=Photorhabdus luminescens TaxID=29488 RepID=UPI000B4DC597|nr:hypothetical protein [Photorhabdus luminescens]OWO81617.1 hypothetical protein B5C26_13345 [Photorhabdus luminescens]
MKKMVLKAQTNMIGSMSQTELDITEQEWNKKPSQTNNGSWFSESLQSQYEIVAIVDLEDIDWKETLVEI